MSCFSSSDFKLTETEQKLHKYTLPPPTLTCFPLRKWPPGNLDLTTKCFTCKKTPLLFLFKSVWDLLPQFVLKASLATSSATCQPNTNQMNQVCRGEKCWMACRSVVCTDYYSTITPTTTTAVSKMYNETYLQPGIVNLCLQCLAGAPISQSGMKVSS